MVLVAVMGFSSTTAHASTVRITATLGTQSMSHISAVDSVAAHQGDRLFKLSGEHNTTAFISINDHHQDIAYNDDGMAELSVDQQAQTQYTMITVEHQ